MLKYLYDKEIFQEVPDEITLGISITNCHIHCPGCHSTELWKDIGKPLTVETLMRLLKKHKGVTCLCLMGGEHDIDALTELFYHAKKYVKTAWYCGLDELPKDKYGITQYLDYIKIGSYKKELGGLDSPKTNQKFYFLENYGEGKVWHDFTYKFQKHGEL